MRSFSSWPIFVPKPLRLTLLALVVVCASVSPRYSVTAKAQTRRPGANVMAWQTLKWAQHVPTTYKGRAESVAKLQGGAAPLAMVSADFDGDGIADLVVGYAGSSGGILALHRGNLDAFAPRSHASWLAIANEQFPSPFLAQAGVVEVPESPSFIVAGDFMGDGNIGILTGARGSQHLYFLAGDGKGKFSAPKLINLPGTLSALASGEVGIRDGKTDVVASVLSGRSAALLVYKGSAGGLTATGISYPLPQAATQLEIGDLHGDGFNDVAALAGGEVFIVHPTAQAGEDTASLLEHVTTASGARSIAVGGFIWDRHSRNQLAVLNQSGVVQILSPEELDTRPFTDEERFERRTAAMHGVSVSDANPVWAGEAHSWNVVKSNSVSAPMSANVRLMAAGLAHSRPLDLMVVDPADTRVHVLPANTSFEADNDEGELTIETGDAPTAVLPMRVNGDARRGLVMIGKSVSHPKTMAPLPDPTYTVNRFDDPAATVANAASYCLGAANDCSFRQAVIKANSVSGSDTIMLPPGTITLSITGTKENLAVTGDVDVRDTVSIVGSVDGSNNPTSIITGGGGWNDKFISTNKDGTTNGGLSVSNVIFQNGNNTNSTTPFDPAFNYLGGALDFYGCAPEGGGCSVAGVASLFLTNVRFVNNHDTGCTAQICGGGADAEFGPVAVSGSTFSGNVVAGQGGALTLVGSKETMSITNSTFTGNQSNIEGGAIMVNFENVNATGTIAIHNTTISNNSSTTSDGGGIYYFLGPGSGVGPLTTASATIDQKTVISGNSAQRGGGLVFKGVSNTGGPGNNTTLTISKTTITGNSSSSGDGGGGIFVLSQGHLNVSFSRIVHNTAPAGKPTGLSVQPDGATVTATDNWWGCDPGPTAAPCDTAAVTPGSGATLTTSPWLVLSLAANPTSVQAIPPSNTSELTADFLHDSSNGQISAANLDVLLGLPISFGANAGSISAAQTTIQFDGTAAATFTHAASCAASSATATVDTNPPPTVSTNITILCPDLVATKANSLGVSGVTTPLSSPSWTWFVNIANPTAANGAPATFADGQTILTDSLPGTNISYGPVTIGGVAGTVTNVPDINCSIVSNVLTCTASGGSVTLGSGGGGGNFQASFTATATAAGSYVNPSGGSCGVDPNNNIIEFNEANNSCSNTVIVLAPPTISKAFLPAGVPVNGPTSITFTLTNPAANTVSLTGVGFTDVLPAGPTVGPSSSSPCGGTLTTVSPGTIILTGATISPGGQCQFGVPVMAPSTPGQRINTTGNVQSTNGGQGLTATATLNVFAPPSIAKSFGAATIPLNGTTSVTFQISNPSANPGTLTGIGFNDTLPAGVVVATPSGATGTCNGTTTATSGTGSISLNGATLAANTSCSVAVNVAATSAGSKSNSVTVSSIDGGTGNTDTANLAVIAPPTLSKGFGAASIMLAGSTSLTFTVGNPAANPYSLTVSFTDTLPAGLVVSTPSGLSTTCSGSASAAAGTVSLSSASLTAGSTCSLSVNVTAVGVGPQNNTATPTSPEGGSGTPATASITVNAPVQAGTSTSVTSSLNPSFTTAPNNSVTFTATVTSSAAPVIEGTVTFKEGATVLSGPTAVNGSGQATFTTTSLPEGSHVITAVYNGTVDFLTSNGSITQVVNNHTVVSGNQYCNPGAITMANTAGAATPYPSNIFVSGAGSSTNTLTLALNHITSSDVQNLNLLLIDPTGKKYIPLAHVGSSTPVSNVDITLADAAASALPNGSTLVSGSFKPSSYSGGSLLFSAPAPTGSYDYAASDGAATFASEFNGVNPNGTWQLYAQTTNAEGGSIGTGWCLNITSTPPDLTITKTHSGDFTQGDTGDTYTITVTNSGTVPTTGAVTMTDTLPTGLTATALAGTGWSCTLTPLSCTRSDSLPATNSYDPITLTVDVASDAPATVTNSATVSGGGETNAGNDTATDPTTVGTPLPDLTISKSHAGNFSQGQTGAAYSITVGNAGPGATTGTISVVDTLPTGLTATNMSGAGWNCSLGTLTCTRTTAMPPSSFAAAITLVVNVASNAPASVTNSATVSGGGETNTANDTANDTTTIGAPPDLSIAKSHTGNFTQGDTGDTYTITAKNNGPVSTSGTVTMIDTLPAGLTATAASGSGWTCDLSNPPLVKCTNSNVITSGNNFPDITLTVNVSPTAGSSVTNQATVSGSGDNTNQNDIALDSTTINPAPDLSISKTAVGTFTQGQPAEWDVTVSNTSPSSVTNGTVTVSDSLPPGYSASSFAAGLGWSCSGTTTVTCTDNSVVAGGSSFPVIRIFFTVPASSPTSVTNTAYTYGGGDTTHTNLGNAASGSSTVSVANPTPPDLTIAKTHIGTFTQGGSGAYHIIVTNNGPGSTSGTVTVTDPMPSGLTIQSIATGNEWTCTSSTSTNLICTTTSPLTAGQSYSTITATVNIAANAPASVTNTATVSGSGDNTPGNDSASDPTTINPSAPDLTVSKTHSGNFFRGQAGSYTITVHNSGGSSTSGTVTMVDTLPAGMTATALSGVDWNCTIATLTCTYTTPVHAGNDFPPITLTVNVAAGGGGPFTNTATVSGGGETNTSNDTASDPTTVNNGVDLRIFKTHTGDFAQGQMNATYTIKVTNTGEAFTSGLVSVTDTLPAGLTLVSMTGGGWTCNQSTLTCQSGDSVAPGASFPVISLVVNVNNDAPPSVTNQVTVSGGSDVNTGNNSASDPTTIIAGPDLTLTKTHSGNFTQGQTGATYTLTVTNSGGTQTTGGVTVTDTLPSGLTATSMGGSGWICTVSPLSCIRNASEHLAPGASYPPITLTVNVASNAASPVTNQAAVSGGSEVKTNNNTASDPTIIGQAPVPDLTILKQHVGNFVRGQSGSYTISVGNAGGGPTNGTVTMIDTLPSGLTATALTGSGWSCSYSQRKCTRGDALPGGSSYPPITLTVTVSSSCSNSVTNQAAVSGGGETNTANNVATDPTTITAPPPDLTITKSHSGNFTQGQTGATYSIVVKNIGGASSSGTVSVTDTPPAGLTATAISGSGWSCTLSTLTCTRNDALTAAQSYPTITVKVNVSSTAATPLINMATVSGGNDNNAGNNSASDSTTINPGHADLTISKSHTGNFTQGQTGAIYTIKVSNSGGPTSGTVHVTDSLPSGLTATAISGSGWSCSLSSKSCSRSDVLPAASSYPMIQLTVSVASNAPSTVTNSVTISGGGETNTGNDTATDPTNITSVAGQVTVSPTTADFGNVNLGSSKDFPLTVKNGSGSTINITSISITPGSGPAKNDFGYDTKCGGSLSAGKTCTITAKLHAQDLGSGTATLNIFFNGAGSPLHVLLKGTVINPKAKLNKSSIDFGSVKSGHSATSTVTLTSNGDTPLLISSIVASGTGFSQTNNCPASLSPNQSCTVTVTFTASSKTSCAGSLKFNDNATGSPQSVTLSAKGN